MQKTFVVCPKFSMSSNFHFSQLKTYFSQFIDEFLKFEEMEYLIHDVEFEMLPACVNSSSYFQQ